MNRSLMLLALALAGCGDDDAPAEDSGIPEDSSTDGGADAATDGGDETFTLRFAGRVGDEPFACGETYDDVGTSGSTFEPLDLRFYVSNFRLVDGEGNEVPLALTPDEKWQTADVAMIDLEDGSGGCRDGNEDTNDVVIGTAPAGEYTGVKFDLGVPEDLNHQDPNVAPSPLNLVASHHWGWAAGYIFFRLDAKSTGLPDGFFVHVGSSVCDGEPPDVECDNPNRSAIALDGDPSDMTIVADLAELLGDTDIDTNEAGPPICMSGTDDTECAEVFAKLGLAFGDATAGEQTFFSAE